MTTSDRRKALIAKFRGITRERIASIAEMLTMLDGNGGDDETIAGLMREIHTIKGEAKIMGFALMSHVAHRTEDLLLSVKQKGFALSLDEGELIFAGLDLLGVLVEAEKEPPQELAERGARFAANVTAQLEAPSEEPESPSEDVAAEPAPKGAPAPRERDVGRAAAPQSLDESFVRVDSSTLVSLTNRTGELLRRQEQTDRVLSDLARLVRDLSSELGVLQGTDLNVHFEADGSSLRGTGSLTTLMALAKELGATLGVAREEAFESRLQIGELQETVRRMRMCPVRTLFAPYPRAIRELAREMGKRVRVTLDDAVVHVDKQIVDRLADPLLHLVRNSVDHGIEPPEERRAAGKEPQATVTLSARQVGGRVEIAIADDGRGISVEQVRARAASLGLLSKGAELDREEALGLIFAAGFSTRAEATDISGRGVGLDVVKRAVEELGGTIRVVSELGQGARFILDVPISVALTRALVVESSAGFFALPSTGVVSAATVPAASVVAAGSGRAIQLDDELIPLISLEEVLGYQRRDIAKDLHVVVVAGANHDLAVEVQGFVGERQVIKRALDPFLQGLQLLNGTAILEAGNHCFFLNTSALMRKAPRASAVARAPAEVVQRRRRSILVVDDSEITRDVIVSTLRRLGYDPLEAVDGKDAQDKMAHALPDLLLTDLDMPVLDGIGLIHAVRADARTSDLPIVVLSTRGSNEDKQRAMAAGANAYLVKATFREQEMAECLQMLLPD